MSSTVEMCVFVRLSVESPKVQDSMCCLWDSVENGLEAIEGWHDSTP